MYESRNGSVIINCEFLMKCLLHNYIDLALVKGLHLLHNYKSRDSLVAKKKILVLI